MTAAPNEQLLIEREHAFTEALRAFDPEAVVHIDRHGGPLSVSTVLDENEVLAVLASVGVEAAPAGDPHAHGGCCGGCGGG